MSRAYPDQAQQVGAGAHVQLRPGGMQPHPGRPPRPLAPGEGKGTLLRRVRPGADRDEEGPRPGIPERGVLACRCSRRCGTSTRRSPRSSPGAPGTRGSSPAAPASPRTTPESAFTLRGGELRLAKMSAPLRFVWSWPVVDLTALDPAMVIISREPDGRLYVTFTVDAAAPEPAAARPGTRVGVHLGVTDFAVTSRRAAGSPTRGTWSARPAVWPATSGAWLAARKGRPTGPRRRPRLLAPTARSATRGGTSCTGPALGWSARPIVIVIEDLNVFEHGPQPASGPRDRRLRLGRVPPPARVQVRSGTAAAWS